MGERVEGARVRCGLVVLSIAGAGSCVVDDPSYLGPVMATDSGEKDTEPDGAIVNSVTSTTKGVTTSSGSGSATVQTTVGTMADTTAEPTDGCAGWWDPAWTHRRRLVLDNRGQAESLEAFTVLVTLDAATFDYAEASPDGRDLRFVDDDGATVLPHHIEHWEPGGASQVWVRVPRIDAGSASDHLWLYHGNTAAPDLDDPAGSYDEHHVGVWHLHETSGAHTNSATGGFCTWLGGGNGTQDASGRIDGANEFDGIVDGVDCGQDQVADTATSTITAWVRLPLIGDGDQCVVSLEAIGPPFPGLSLYVDRGSGEVGTWYENGTIYHPAVTITPGQWVLIGVRGFRDSVAGTIEVSVDGNPWQPLLTGDTNDLRIEPGTPLALGQWPGGGFSAKARGIIDEVRISTAGRSDAWIRAQYLSGSGAFVTDEGDQAASDVCG